MGIAQSWLATLGVIATICFQIMLEEKAPRDYYVCMHSSGRGEKWRQLGANNGMSQLVSYC